MKLTISFVECCIVNDRGHYWFELETEQETCQCCYVRNGEDWVYEEGDNEPDMPHELQVLFNEVGNEVFVTALLNGKAELYL